MPKLRAKDWVVLPVILAGMVLVFVLSNFLASQRRLDPPPNDTDELTLQGSRLKGFVFGAEGLVADWYWMRSLQYIGDKVLNSPDENINIGDLRSLDPRLLYPYLNNATDLDPHYMPAYSYGAVVLPAIDPELAIKIAEKGIAANPGEWRLYQYLGYVEWQLNRYDKAADVYDRGSRIDGAPTFLKMMAVSMRTAGSSRETARSVFRQMYEHSGDEQTRLFAERKLEMLKSLDERDAIRHAMNTVKERTGRCPAAWAEIIPLLHDVKLPGGNDFRIDANKNIVDPSGAPYLLDQETCDVLLDKKTTKIPLQ
jgi:tetratricopeptide (TPR) repeat protein